MRAKVFLLQKNFRDAHRLSPPRLCAFLRSARRGMGYTFTIARSRLRATIYKAADVRCGSNSEVWPPARQIRSTPRKQTSSGYKLRSVSGQFRKLRNRKSNATIRPARLETPNGENANRAADYIRRLKSPRVYDATTKMRTPLS